MFIYRSMEQPRSTFDLKIINRDGAASLQLNENTGEGTWSHRTEIFFLDTEYYNRILNPHSDSKANKQAFNQITCYHMPREEDLCQSRRLAWGWVEGESSGRGRGHFSVGEGDPGCIRPRKEGEPPMVTQA